MKHHYGFVGLVCLVLSASALAQLPKRDLLIEMRHIEEGRDGSDAYRVGTSPNTASHGVTHSLSVRNGEKGTLRTHQSVPMQWVQSAQTQGSSAPAQPAPASNSSANTNNSGNGNSSGVTQALHWFDVGHSITMTPKWPGGKKDVVLEIEVVQSEMKTVYNADFPQQERRHLSSTITVPLNLWVTIAASGKAAAPTGSYSSESTVDARRLLQVRLQAP